MLRKNILKKYFTWAYEWFNTYDETEREREEKRIHQNL